MAQLGGMQDPTGGQTAAPRDALPAGEYVAALVKSEGKQTKDGSGSYVACEFEVMDGQFKGRRFWTNLNLQNRNQEAVDIAWRTLNSMKHACGRLNINDTEELHGIPMRVKLKVKTDAQYGDKNEPTSFAPLNGAPMAHQQTAHTSGQPVQTASAAPWGRRG